MIQNILNWVFTVVGNFLLKTAVSFLESKWPGLTPIIDKILALLGQNVPPAALALHLDQFVIPKKV